ncbi:MAG TPA: extracellular solute-binding protein, partial [Caldilineaceae bacterium]|nr:extracellular solute-binding protein [Caldilineaceae bacterium]
MARPNQRYLRRRWPGWLALLIVLCLALGCNDEPPPTPTPAAPSDQPAQGVNAVEAGQATVAPTPSPTPHLVGRIVLWHSWAEADGDALSAILTAFQQRHPGITVETLFVAYNDLPQSYADAVAAGAGPDLVLSPSWWLDDLVAAGAVQRLDELVDPAELGLYWPAALDHLRRHGQLFGLPTHF